MKQITNTDLDQYIGKTIKAAVYLQNSQGHKGFYDEFPITILSVTGEKALVILEDSGLSQEIYTVPRVLNRENTHMVEFFEE